MYVNTCKVVLLNQTKMKDTAKEVRCSGLSVEGCFNGGFPLCLLLPPSVLPYHVPTSSSTSPYLTMSQYQFQSFDIYFSIFQCFYCTLV